MSKNCLVDTCDRKVTRGYYCKPHYYRLGKYGNPFGGRTYFPRANVVVGVSESERFWAYVDRRGQHDCWEWQKCRNRKGYGFFRFEGRRQMTHRISYQLTHGTINPDLMVLHSCDNPPCVNPNHLRQGTAADNAQDAVRRGRRKYLVSPARHSNSEAGKGDSVVNEQAASLA